VGTIDIYVDILIITEFRFRIFVSFLFLFTFYHAPAYWRALYFFDYIEHPNNSNTLFIPNKNYFFAL